MEDEVSGQKKKGGTGKKVYVGWRGEKDYVQY